MSGKNKAALYVRVSTNEQVENYSIEVQKERLAAFCKSKGWDIFDTYIDPGYSGATMERPGLQRLLTEIAEIDVVVVYKLDRLSRSQRDTLELIEEHFLKSNVDFVSITETLDTSTPFGKAMIGILSVFAQLERETIAERMRMGHIKRAENGYYSSGGNYDPAGYARVDGELVIKPDEAKHIQLAFDLYEQYLSITKVQVKLKEMGYKVWRFRRYRDILGNKLYAGYVSFAGVWYKGRHEAIISEEQFERVQALLNRHKGKNAYKAKESLLSGLLYCGKCGEVYHTYQSKDKLANGEPVKYRYYICRARRFPAEYDRKCLNKTWNSRNLEGLITNEINNLTTSKELADKRVNNIDYDKLLKNLDAKVERLIKLYAEGDKIPVEFINKQVAEAEEERKELIQRKRVQANQLQELITPEELGQYTLDINSTTFQTRHAVVHKLIKRVIIHEENLEIEWNF